MESWLVRVARTNGGFGLLLLSERPQLLFRRCGTVGVEHVFGAATYAACTLCPPKMVLLLAGQLGCKEFADRSALLRPANGPGSGNRQSPLLR
jgi:hypothetical protein